MKILEKEFKSINNSKANILNSLDPAHFYFKLIELHYSVIVAIIHFKGFEEIK